MNRVDELTLRLLDEGGTKAERAELARLLDRDRNARGKHITLVELEATLRGSSPPPDVLPVVMEHVRAERRGRRRGRSTLHNVPSAHKRRSFLARWAQLASRWRMWLLWLLLLGSATAAALYNVQSHRPSALAAPVARLALQTAADKPGPVG
jgi:hypothetical protein